MAGSPTIDCLATSVESRKPLLAVLQHRHAVLELVYLKLELLVAVDTNREGEIRGARYNVSGWRGKRVLISQKRVAIAELSISGELTNCATASSDG